jgi:integrase/recombinase XerD
MSTTPSTAVERYQPVMSEAKQTTLLGFLAGYRGSTRDAYTLDLRQFTAWCWQRQHRLFEVRRVDIECVARHLEDRGKSRATVARRLCTIVGFYRYAEQEGVIEHSPGVHIRRPRIDYESHLAHLDATSSERSSSPPDCHRHAIMRWSHCWR